jgi:hypothetical protein
MSRLAVTGSAFVFVFVYPTPAQFLVAARPDADAAHRTGTAWDLVVVLGGPPATAKVPQRKLGSGPKFDISRRARASRAVH